MAQQSFINLENLMKTPTPMTNLLGHQALTTWYREVITLEEQGVPICVLMLRIPGEFTSMRTPCDIREKRTEYLQAKPRCFHGVHCLPRLRDIRAKREKAP